MMMLNRMIIGKTFFNLLFTIIMLILVILTNTILTIVMLNTILLCRYKNWDYDELPCAEAHYA